MARYRSPVKRTRLPELAVKVAGARVPAHTLLGCAGAHQLTLSTALPALGVELHSSYLGHPDAPESVASHLQLGPNLTPRTWVETRSGSGLPVSEARRRCLYDHALELQQLLGCASGGHVTVELVDDALELVDVA